MNWNVKGEVSSLEDLLNVLLKNRGLLTNEDRKKFLEPTNLSKFANDFNEDFSKSLIASKKLIKTQIQQNKPILIHGDYDADGVCATAILYNTILKELGYKNVYYQIPNRFSHGYGLSQKSIDYALNLINQPEVLVVTVDSGITAVDEVNYLHKLGHKIIITDHHQKPSIMPSADVVLWDDKIVGSSISWFLSKAIGSKDNKSISLAAIATITDIQPVLGLNRLIVKRGLDVINKNPPAGIAALIKVSQAGNKFGAVTTYDIGWVLGPRLNASGRLETAHYSLDLLILDQPEKIAEAANILNTINTERQEMTLSMFEYTTVPENNPPNIIISINEKYHEGLIGLVAAKLVQKYNRPSIVISLEDGIAKGSARSLNNINIIELLRNFESLFISLGGHSGAAGFSADLTKLEEIKNNLGKYADEHFSSDDFKKTLEVDSYISEELINNELVNISSSLEPYGIGNPDPVYATKNLKISNIDWVGSQKTHLKLSLYSAHLNTFFKGILFSAQEKISNINEFIKIGQIVEIAYKPKLNTFNEKTYIDLQIVDIRLQE